MFTYVVESLSSEGFLKIKCSSTKELRKILGNDHFFIIAKV